MASERGAALLKSPLALCGAAGVVALACKAAGCLVLSFWVGDPKLLSLGDLYLNGVLAATLLPALGLLLLARLPDPGARLDRAARKVFLATGLFYLASMISMSLLKAGALHYYADRATHLELLWRSANGLGLTSPMTAAFWTGPHWFAAHFTPILYLLIWPFFKLVPGQPVLTVLQTVYLFGAAVPVGLYARDRLGGQAGWWAASAVLLYPTLQYINLYGLAYLELSIPLLAWAFYALHRRSWAAYGVLIALSLTVREEVGFVVLMLGLYAGLVRGERLAGAATAAAGLIYSLVVIKLVIPSFRGDGGLVYLDHYKIWGESLPAVLAAPLTQPLKTLGHLLGPVRFGNMILLLLPFGFLPLLSPAVLIGLPTVFAAFMSRQPANSSFMLYYLSPVLPFVFMAAVDGLYRVRARLTAPGLSRLGPALPAAAFACSLCACVLFGPSPISLQFWLKDYRVGIFYTTNFHRSEYRATERAGKARRVAALVPGDAVVAAEQYLLPLLYDREMRVFPDLDGADHALIDKKNPKRTGWAGTYLDFRRRPAHYYARVEDSPAWTLVEDDDGIRLYRRTVTP